MDKIVDIYYFAALKDFTTLDSERYETNSETALDLYREIQKKYELPLAIEQIKVAANDHFCSFNYALKNGDKIVFIPPVSGG